MKYKKHRGGSWKAGPAGIFSTMTCLVLCSCYSSMWTNADGGTDAGEDTRDAIVEPPDELLEDSAHPVVVETGEGAEGLGAEVDARVEELLDEGAKRVGLREPGATGLRHEGHR